MTAKIKINVADLTPQFIKEIKEKYGNRQLEINVTPPNKLDHLGESLFWEIIKELDWSKKGDNTAVLAPAIKKLAAQPIRFIYQFQDILAQKLFLLDGEKYAQHIGSDAFQEGKYFSVDQFLYARCCVVANGQAAFDAILANPTLMPKDLTFEPILSLAANAFQLKTGKPFNYFHTSNYETYSNEKGWA